MDRNERNYCYEPGNWHIPTGDHGYAYEKMYCGHTIAVVEISIANLWLMLLDGAPVGFENGGLGQVESKLEGMVRRLERNRGAPSWDGSERRIRKRGTEHV